MPFSFERKSLNFFLSTTCPWTSTMSRRRRFRFRGSRQRSHCQYRIAAASAVSADTQRRPEPQAHFFCQLPKPAATVNARTACTATQLPAWFQLTPSCDQCDFFSVTPSSRARQKWCRRCFHSSRRHRRLHSLHHEAQSLFPSRHSSLEHDRNHAAEASKANSVH